MLKFEARKSNVVNSLVLFRARAFAGYALVKCGVRLLEFTGYSTASLNSTKSVWKMSLDLIVSKPFYKQMGEGFRSARLTIHVLPAHESFFYLLFWVFSGHGARDKPSEAHPLIVQTHVAPISRIARLYWRRYAGYTYSRKRARVRSAFAGPSIVTRALMSRRPRNGAGSLPSADRSSHCLYKLSRAFASPYSRLASLVQRIFLLSLSIVEP